MSNVTTEEQGNVRLLRLASILDAADEYHKQHNEPAYKQRSLIHPCGTPACAGGHWDASPEGQELGGSQQDWRKTFAINGKEESELFGGEGCGDARTAKEAAEYLRSFVARRRNKTALDQSHG